MAAFFGEKGKIVPQSLAIPTMYRWNAYDTKLSFILNLKRLIWIMFYICFECCNFTESFVT